MKVIDTIGDRSQAGCILEECFVKYLDTVQISPLLFCVKCPMCPLLSACQAGEQCETPGTCPASRKCLLTQDQEGISPKMCSTVSQQGGVPTTGASLQHIPRQTIMKVSLSVSLSLTEDVSQVATHHAGQALPL